MPTLPALRQVVLLARDLTGALDEARGFLGLNQGIRDAESMAALGFEHEVLAIDETFLEMVSPLSAESSAGRLLAARGEGGYMVVLQVPDLDALVDRAAGLDLKPILHETFEGNPMSQWHPRDLGTLAELDEMRVADWHFCPALSDTGSTAVASDIVAVELAVPDPEAYARRWAALLALESTLDPGATVVPLGSGELRFVPLGDGGPGLRRVRLAASLGTPDTTATLCGVRFEVLADPAVTPW
jgi:hypothetical protein